MTQSELLSSSIFSVRGRVAVVTGGATGIGYYIASALVENGATVYIIGRRQHKLDEAVEARSGKSGRMIGIQGDVTKKDDLERIAEIIKKESGHVNLLVANSGISGPPAPYPSPSPSASSIEELQTSLWKPSLDDWHPVFDTNVFSVYFTAVAFLPLLHQGSLRTKEEGFTSSIVTISSIAGYIHDPLVGFAYGASKAAVTHLTRTLARYLGEWKIRSNVIAPGVFESEMTSEWPDDDTIPNLVKRKGFRSEIAGLAVLLASPAGGFLNSAVLTPDGGHMLLSSSSF